MYVGIWHLKKTYSFFSFQFLIKKSTGLYGSRWLFQNIIHKPLQINKFILIYMNIRVKSFYRIKKITGWIFSRDISSIYLKCFWGNFRVIPWIYKCEAFTNSFKFINQLWIIKNVFITVSSNLFNPEKIIFCADIILDRNNFVTWNNTRGHQKWASYNR